MSAPAPKPSRRQSSIVPNVNFQQVRLRVLLDVDVDGEMGVDVAHFVLVAFGHANDEIVDDGFNRSKGSDAFPGAMVELDVDDCFRGVGKVDREMGEVFGEGACNAFLSSESVIKEETPYLEALQLSLIAT